jgi:phosphoribosylamine--glycine ligase
VIISETTEEAKTTLKEMLADKKFGDASSKVVIEEYLSGIELSVFVLTDGKDYVILPEAKDYKRIGEKDTGLNTGGMGAVSPVSFADKLFLEEVENTIIIPTIDGLKKENIVYRGFIFIGIMSVAGRPYVIEYNARMGDPETEVVIPRIKNDFLELLIKTGRTELKGAKIDISSETATTIMLVAGGYPGDYKKGDVISGLSDAKDVLTFHAGTLVKGGDVVTNGGRVIALTGFGNSIEEAIEKSNKAAEAITWNGRYFRRDIGLDLLELAK